MASTFAGSMYPKLNVEATDEEKEEEDSAETGSTTSFSLQECINEFRARRIRRVSTQSRDCDMPPPPRPTGVEQSSAPVAADAHLINQNRSNKAQERKSKPCENGFCYCFTSDSGDCGSTAPPPRDWHVRQNKRSRRSESNKFSAAQRPANNLNAQQTRTRRQSLPVENKQQTGRTSTTKSPLTAISSLRAVGDDAPLIHIIQELRDNCVVSEVRVNRDKLSSTARASSAATASTKFKAALPKVKKAECIEYQPTAPALSNISEQETLLEQSDNMETTATSLADASLRSTRRSSRRSSSGGRLLRKRLSEGLVNFKTHDMQQPPPKPPRRSAQSLDGKFSLSSLSSTTPSVRSAERVLDEFLRKHGVEVPTSNKEKLPKTKTKRKSFPLAEKEKPIRSAPLPTCPSLSDIERVVESKRGVHYAKNIHMASRKSAVADKPMKEIVIGWTEPKINDMLNYDSAKQAQFKTHAPDAAPQVASIGWQVPVVPKVSLDTVDGVSENLESNMAHKHTPIKYPRLNTSKKNSQKFIWGEQWRNLSWNGTNNRTGLRTKSKKFLNNSKNKILRFVSPKKSNQPELPRHTPRLCTVGVQTSTSQLQLDLHSQSPPGSYHSPVQSTPSASTTHSTSQQQFKHSSEQEHFFDFQRKVKPPTPPKKWPRAQRARKLNFQDHGNPTATTYRSYHKDLDQDVTITKMGYLLSSIRAKLEASDEHAVRTFRECSRFVPEEQSTLSSSGFDCTDGPSSRTRRSTTVRVQNCDLGREPIYSEIEEDCIHISGSPQFDVRTEAQLEVAPTPTPTPTPMPTPTSSPTRTTTITATSIRSETTAVPSPSSSSYAPVADLNELYAKVQKCKKAVANATQTKPSTQPRPLGQFLQESLLNGSIFQFMPLPDEPCSDTTHTKSSLKSFNAGFEQPLHQSLNNINEQHSPPKKNRNLTKSNLSLQRSEIFLENLCRSEIVLDQDDNVRLEKVENTCLRAQNAAALDTDNVSYDMPNEVYDEYGLNEANNSWLATNANSQYGSVQLEPPPPSSDNQSTPKKQTQRYTTKPPQNLSIDINADPTVSAHTEHIIHSCPTTPQQPLLPNHVQPAHSSLDELTQRQPNESNLLSVSTLARYRLLKAALRRSYRKGKDFFVAEKQKLAHSLSISRDQSNQTEGEQESSSYYASFNVDSLLNESLPFNEQLAQAVSICRQMPELEISPEMVEAERLLLFSTLRKKALPAVPSESTLAASQQSQCFLLDGLRLPVKADVSQDMFFNYYYICAIECDGRIRSTQSIECRNGAAVFSDCGLEFYSSSPAETLKLRCKIFMLRLRKVSTLSLEPAKTQLKRGSGTLGSGSSSNSSQSEQIISRFRLHASFTLNVSDLVPYEQVCSDAQPSDKIWLRSSGSWVIPLTTHTKYSNLMPEIEVNGRVDLRLPKLQFAGYLNVQDTDPNNKHNWNRRWCTLDGLSLSVWQHEHNLSEQPPLLALQLESCLQSELAVAPRELCARARSFLLQCGKLGAFFAADTQPELADWLLHLNEALAFARRWLGAS